MTQARAAPASPASLLPDTSMKNVREVPQIRVRIAKEKSLVEISGLDLQRTLHLTKKSRDFSGRKSIRFNCQRFGEKNKQHLTLQSPLLLASLSSRTGLLTIENERFHGQLKVVSNTSSDGCDVIHQTDLEDYIATLLAKEMNATWPIEALKAQAIAARTYAYHKMESQQVSRTHGYEAFYDLESSESHQVSGNFFDATEKTLAATRATRGMILETHGGELTEIFFHAKCGGHTIAPDRVWTTKVAGYEAIADPYCEGRGNMKTWTAIITKKRLSKFFHWAKKKSYIHLDHTPESDALFFVSQNKKDPSMIKFSVDGHVVTLKKSLFRRYFGRTLFQSNNFSLEIKDSNLLVTGEGKGHGVGMCQIGALGMADLGKNYREILNHYLPGHKMKEVY